MKNYWDNLPTWVRTWLIGIVITVGMTLVILGIIAMGEKFATILVALGLFGILSFIVGYVVRIFRHEDAA